LAYVVLFTFMGAHGSAAQDLHAIARINVEKSEISDRLLGGVAVKLSLSQAVPFRVFTLDGPKRLVVDFKEVDWSLFSADDILDTEAVTGVRYGIFRPGWSRMVLDLDTPLEVENIEMDTGANQGGPVTLSILMKYVSSTDFAEKAGAPDDDGWHYEDKTPKVASRGRQMGDRPLVVAIDAGHGGIDPGATRYDHEEKHLVLLFARELKEALILTGRYSAAMTRDQDEFVSLPDRITRARAFGADVFISLHADALAKGTASGTTVYTLSEKASDEAAETLAAQHDRSDLLAGVDLSRQDDQVATVLMDMARLETAARSEVLAEMLVVGISESVGHLHKRPHLSAGFTVLKAPDIPSVLVELGFMSNEHDLKNLLNKKWRAQVIEGLVAALDMWAVEDAAQALLLRK
jgi:N-acetylmuramoyl-L-alanine amidase